MEVFNPYSPTTGLGFTTETDLGKSFMLTRGITLSAGTIWATMERAMPEDSIWNV